ncbi:hypothetical protein KIPB_007054 [Kipferlia bialata]|uniref:Uncharacterized protein n=1 Tax=Kipferlia bialata TaxID=797122 RepID=A0A9K3CZF9_9EUKA|nr:hypothetical protein KIPB_007054 [Kipferlia bialata]|eukprot:g7054.t1
MSHNVPPCAHIRRYISASLPRTIQEMSELEDALTHKDQQLAALRLETSSVMSAMQTEVARLHDRAAVQDRLRVSLERDCATARKESLSLARENSERESVQERERERVAELEEELLLAKRNIITLSSPAVGAATPHTGRFTGRASARSTKGARTPSMAFTTPSIPAMSGRVGTNTPSVSGTPGVRASERLAASKAAGGSSRAQVETLSKRLSRSESARERAEAQIHRIQEQMAQALPKLEVMKTQLNRVTQQRDKYQAEAAEAEASTSALQQSYRDERRRGEALQREVATLRNHLTSMAAEACAARGSTTSYRDIDSILSENVSLKESLHALGEKETKRERERHQELVGIKEEWGKREAEHEERVNALKAELESMRTAVETASAERERERDELQQERKRMEGENDAEMRRLEIESRSQSYVSQITAELAAARVEVSTLTTKLAKASAHATHSQSLLDGLTVQHEALTKAHTDMESKNATLSSLSSANAERAMRMSLRATHAEKELTAASNRACVAEAAAAELQASISSHQATAADRAALYPSLSSIMDKIERGVEAGAGVAEQRNVVLEAEAETLRAETASLKATIDTLKEEVKMRREAQTLRLASLVSARERAAKEALQSKATVKQFQLRAEAAEGVVQGLRDRLVILEGTVGKTAQKELTAKRALVQSQGAKITALTSTLAGVRAECASLKAKAAETESDKAGLVATLNTLKSHAAAETARRQSVERSITVLGEKEREREKMKQADRAALTAQLKQENAAALTAAVAAVTEGHRAAMATLRVEKETIQKESQAEKAAGAERERVLSATLAGVRAQAERERESLQQEKKAHAATRAATAKLAATKTPAPAAATAPTPTPAAVPVSVAQPVTTVPITSLLSSNKESAAPR